MKPSYRLKVDRALQLFKPLRAEIEAYRARRPFSFRHAIRPATREEVQAFATLPNQLPGRLRITADRTDLIAHEARIIFEKEAPLEEWSLRIAEIIQHLRSALDVLAYSLAHAHSGPLDEKTARQITFPICETNKAWLDAERRITSIRSDVRQQIEQFQPYHVQQKGSPNWGLRILQYFNNLDKHRFLVMAGAKPAHISIEGLVTIEDGYTPMTQMALGALESGTVVALCLSPTEFPAFKVSDSYAVDIALPRVPLPNGHDNLPVVAVVSTLGHNVTQVIDALDGQ